MSHLTLNMAGALAAALVAADQHGLLEALGEAPASAEQLAVGLHLDSTATERVLEVLRTHGFLSADGACYALSESTRAELDGPHGRPGEALQFWSRCPSWLRTGTPPREVRREEQGYAMIVSRLAKMFRPATERLAPVLAEALSSHTRPTLLDVGAGAGAWGLALLERLPTARLTALDRPEVLRGFERAAEVAGFASRVTSWPGDFHAMVLDRGPFDLVMLANVVHLDRAEAAQELIRRTADRVSAGGMFVIVDMLSDGSAEEERSRASYAMNLAMRIDGGYPHREDELRRWMRKAGLKSACRLPLAGNGLTALIAERA